MAGKIKVKMIPGIENAGSVGGIRTVITKYFRHLPKFGVELVKEDATTYDLVAAHAGMAGGEAAVSHLHGVYFTADYNANDWEWRVNARIVESIRNARIVTVPSPWVAETIQRDCRFNPVVVPHGIDWEEWQHNEPNEGYIIGYAKNRVGDVCDNSFLTELGKRFPNQIFTTTFAPKTRPNNVKLAELVPHDQFRTFVQRAAVYISPVKETFCLGALEAMASGVPVLGWNYGGNSFLVSHGVSGYLAEPGNLDDLYAGLDYCLRYRDTLGANGRELAKRWTWEAACRVLVKVYEQAMQPEPATVSVVIPVYNKTVEQLTRAIESAARQTLKPSQIIVVDDGSEKSYADRLPNVTLEYFRTPNQGVAAARNKGIAAATSKYIACLDADDWLEPTFLETCIAALESDRSLGIAYTGLRWHNAAGETGISAWPPEFNYDNQLRRQNQVPTACVFRRDAWQRVGGYKSRYCPNGAGSEDAAFWTAIGSIGYNAKKVTDEALFNYSAGVGQVNGNPNYSEVDWLTMYPWVKDGLHPFASVATPARHSHPVRQYDQPEISVIIPVGPGHERAVINALDSLEMQHFRKWEAIVVLDTTLEVNEFKRFKQAYPYARLIESFDKNAVKDGRGFANRGAGVARNLGASIARAPFLFFLDADDVLNQPDSLDQLMTGWQQEEAIIYSDYLGKSTWKLEDAQKEFGDRLLGYIDRTGQAVVRYHAAEYDYDRAIREPNYNPNNPKMPYYLWCTVSVLIPTAWHQAIGGFDESMATWEDVDYFWRLARAGYCFRRVPEPLMLYNYDSGHRREASIPRDETSRQKHQNMINYIKLKYEKQGVQMCNCRGKRSAVTTPEAVITGERIVYNGNVRDEDLILVEFTPNYSGNRQLVGMSTKIRYGYSRRAGERFLVHKADVAAQPHLFKPVPAVVEPPRVEIKEPPPPELVTATKVDDQGKETRVQIPVSEVAQPWPKRKAETAKELQTKPLVEPTPKTTARSRGKRK